VLAWTHSLRARGRARDGDPGRRHAYALRRYVVSSVGRHRPSPLVNGDGSSSLHRWL